MDQSQTRPCFFSHCEVVNSNLQVHAERNALCVLKKVARLRVQTVFTRHYSLRALEAVWAKLETGLQPPTFKIIKIH